MLLTSFIVFLFALSCFSPPIDVKQLGDESISSLIKAGAVEIVNRDHHKPVVSNGDYVVYNTSELAVSTLGKAAIKGILSKQNKTKYLRFINILYKLVNHPIMNICTYYYSLQVVWSFQSRSNFSKIWTWRLTRSYLWAVCICSI